MPIYHFTCEGCLKALRRILEPEQAKVALACPTCGSALVRVPQGPSTLVMERLDNGLMIRPVVRLADAERIFRERSKDSENLKEKY